MGKCYVSKNKEVSSINLNELGSLANRKSQYWLDFENISKEDIEKIKTLIKLHPITIEDLQEEGEEARIKYEQFDDYTFIVFSGIKKITKDEIEPYVLKFIIGKNFIITVHKENMNTINSISSNKKRLTNLMSKGVDYLLYRLIDLEVDLYYPIVEKLEKKIEKADKKILVEKDESELDTLFDIKSINNEIKDLIVPTGRTVLKILKPSNDYIRGEVMIYFRDVYDNIVMINEDLQGIKEQIAGIISERNALLSSNMNQVMKVLTIIATIMMPLTLVSGIYGMNVGLPGQNSVSSFYIIMGIMFFISLIMLAFFKKQKWI
jgi:magnesium transporter